MTSTNEFTIHTVTNGTARPLAIGQEYIIKVESVTVWSDGDIRLYASLVPYEKPNTQLDPDDLNEALDDAIADGDGHLKGNHFIDHMEKRGFIILQQKKE